MLGHNRQTRGKPRGLTRPRIVGGNARVASEVHGPKEFRVVIPRRERPDILKYLHEPRHRGREPGSAPLLDGVEGEGAPVKLRPCSAVAA